MLSNVAYFPVSCYRELSGDRYPLRLVTKGPLEGDDATFKVGPVKHLKADRCDARALKR